MFLRITFEKQIISLDVILLINHSLAPVKSEENVGRYLKNAKQKLSSSLSTRNRL